MKRILIIEDTDTIREELTKLLTRYGYEVLTYGDLKLNLSNGTISCRGKEEELTKNELKILSHLLKNKGNVVSREDLMDYMWNSDIFVDDNTLSVNVTRLRKKLEEVGVKGAIETRRGLGYIMPWN